MFMQVSRCCHSLIIILNRRAKKKKTNNNEFHAFLSHARKEKALLVVEANLVFPAFRHHQHQHITDPKLFSIV